MGTQLPLRDTAALSQFLAHVYCGQTAGSVKTPLGTKVGIALDGDPAPLNGAQQPTPKIFGPCVLWSKAEWIKMPVSTDVSLGSGHVVLEGDPGPPKRGIPPIFGPCLLWPKGSIDQDATWYGYRPRHSSNVIRRVPGSKF